MSKRPVNSGKLLTGAKAAAITWLAYQLAVLQDAARFVFLLWGRQTGKSFTVAAKIAVSLLEGQSWVILSNGQRASNENIAKVRGFLEAAGAVFKFHEVPFAEDARWTESKITLPNGAWVIALPGNKNTARGWSANVWLDEFGFHEDSVAIWRALYWITLRGYRLIISTTANGRNNMAYRIWTDKQGAWSRHKVTLADAVAAGLAIDIDEVRAGYGSDTDGWMQEAMCEFVDETTALLPYELICACEEAALPAPTESWDLAPLANLRDLYGGFDVGRKHDLSVLAAGQKLGDVLWAQAILAMRKTRFAVQDANLSAWFGLGGHRRTCIDATGIGAQLAETMVERFGPAAAEAVVFGTAVNEQLGLGLRHSFEDRRIRIPQDTRLRESLHAVEKVVTAGGNVRIKAARTADGHSDEFYALALLIEAASTPAGGPAGYQGGVSRRAVFAGLPSGGLADDELIAGLPAGAASSRGRGGWR